MKLTEEQILAADELLNDANQLLNIDIVESVRILEGGLFAILGPGWNNPVHAVYLYSDNSIPFAKCYLMLSVCYARLNRYTEALVLADTAADVMMRAGDFEGYAGALNVIGGINIEGGNYIAALEAVQKGLNSISPDKSPALAGKILHNTGIIYQEVFEYESAFQAYNESIRYFNLAGEPSETCAPVNGIGIIMMEMGKYDEALSYFTESFRLNIHIGDNHGAGIALANMGETCIKKGELDSAERYLIQAIEFFKQDTSSIEAVQIYGSVANIKMLRGNFVSAIELSATALEFAVKLQALPLQRDMHFLLAECYEHIGNVSAAIGHLKEYNRLDRKIFSEEKARALAKIELFSSVESIKKDLEISRIRNNELADAVRRLEELNNEKNEFLGIAAHDLKNPLAAITMSAKALQYDDTLTPEETAELTGEILNLSGRMFDIIVELLDINSLEQGNRTIETVPTDIAEIIEATRAMYQRKAAEKNIAMAINISYYPLLANTNSTTLVRVLDNLVSNALKYSPSGTVITINAFATESTVSIEVCDQGLGLSDDDKSKLFGKFARLSARPTGGEHSTGLGLSIVKKLVGLMGGDVYAESEGVGKGSKFIVTLPSCLLEESESNNDAFCQTY